MEGGKTLPEDDGFATVEGAEARRILIVDPDDVQAAELRSLLNAAGYDVVETYDGLEAREFLQRETPSLVYMPLELPRLSGMDLLALMRISGLGEDVPVVVRSNRDDADSLACASEWDIQGVVDEEATSTEVSTTLISLLGGA